MRISDKSAVIRSGSKYESFFIAKVGMVFSHGDQKSEELKKNWLCFPRIRCQKAIRNKPWSAFAEVFGLYEDISVIWNEKRKLIFLTNCGYMLFSCLNLRKRTESIAMLCIMKCRNDMFSVCLYGQLLIPGDMIFWFPVIWFLVIRKWWRTCVNPTLLCYKVRSQSA